MNEARFTGIFSLAVYALSFPSVHAAEPASKPAVTQFSPKGRAHAEDSNLVFKWRPFKSPVVAEYELSLFQVNAGDAPPTLLNHVTVPAGTGSTNELSGPLAPGVYFWRVEAKDRNGKVLALGETRFNAVPKNHRFRMVAGIDLFRPTYLSPNSAFGTEIPSEVNGISTTAEYWFVPRWSAVLDFHDFQMKLTEKNLSFTGLAVGAMYRKPLSRDRAWHVAGGAKIGKDSLPEITATTLTTFQTSSVDRTRFLPFVRVDRRLAPTALIYGHAELNKNLSLGGGGHGPILENRTGLGYRFGFGYEGTISNLWGFDLRLDYFNDGFAYTTATEAPKVIYRGYDVRIGATLRL